MGFFLVLFFGALAFAELPSTLEIKTKDGSVYLFKSPEKNDEIEKRFLDLPSDVQEQFLRKRSEILKMAVQSLHGMRIPVGVWRKSIRPRLDWLYGKSKPIEQPDKNFQETGFVSIQEALSELDKNLWEKSETISNTNEYGMAFELGISGGGKAGSRGVYGITGLGVAVTVDPIERAVALELFGDLEWTKRATPFYGGLGIFGTLMGSAMSTDWKREICAERGSAFCVAGLVGFLSDRYVGLGLSKELGIGFPGAVFMESELTRVPLLRLGASAQWPGFFRVQTALGAPLKKILKSCSVLLGRLQ